jgi:predicted transcriptional regulator
MDRYIKALKEFGLTDNEISVYIESLKHDELSPYQISKITGIPRTTVYDVVMGLALHGLVELEQSDGFTKQQTRVRAKNPSEIRKILEKRRKKLTKIEYDLLNFYPLLKSDYHGEKANADFQFFPGIKGAQKVYLEEDEDGIDIPVNVITKVMPMDIFGKELVNKDVESKIEHRRNMSSKLRELFPLNEWSKHVMTYQKSVNDEYFDIVEMAYIDNPLFDFYHRLSIKGNQVRIVCEEDDEVWGLIITSDSLAKSFNSLFEVLWSFSSLVTEDTLIRWGKNYMGEWDKRKK